MLSIILYNQATHSIVHRNTLTQSIDITLSQWLPNPHGMTMAVAVSGGTDSLALTFLLHDWAQQHQAKVVALHVDHRLRPESTREAHQVNAWLQAKGIPCEILSWDHPPITTKIQETARTARYDLLTQRCHELHIQHLFLAHHADDQLETFFMRLLKGSGLKGLSAIAGKTSVNGIWILRPLLDIHKESLLPVLKGHPYISDPSNQKEIYERIRIRKFLGEGKKLNLSFDHVSQSIERITLADQALDQITTSLFEPYTTCHPQGYISISREVFKNQPLEITHRLIQKILRILNPLPYPPRFQTLETIASFVGNPGSSIAAGKTIWQLKKDQIWISKEPTHVAPPIFLRSREKFMWDKRFLIDNITEKVIYSKVQVGMLGNFGLNVLRGQGIEFDGFHTIYQTIPGLWVDEQLISVPPLDFNTNLGAEFLRMRFLPIDGDTEK